MDEPQGYGPEEVARAMRVLTTALETLEIHDKRDHGGKPCMVERVNLVAWLGHRLGIASDLGLRLLLQLRMLEYQDHHETTQAAAPKN